MLGHGFLGEAQKQYFDICSPSSSRDNKPETEQFP